MVSSIKKKKVVDMNIAIHERLKQLKGDKYNILITGQIGLGKLYNAVNVARYYDPDFDEKNICYSVKDIERLNKKKLKNGPWVIFYI